MTALGQGYPNSEATDLKPVADNRGFRLKTIYEYSVRIRDNKIQPDSILSKLAKFKNERMYEHTSFDSSGHVENHSIYRDGYDRAQDLYFTVDHWYRDGVRKKFLWRTDTTFHDRKDRLFYRNSTGEQKTGKKIFDQKGSLAEWELLYKYSHDSVFHTNGKLYYQDSLLVRRDAYDDNIHQPRYISHYSRDEKGRIIQFRQYDNFIKKDSPKISTTYFYDQGGHLYLIEDSTYDRIGISLPEGGVGLDDVPVHYSYYIEYNEKGFMTRKTQFKNSILYKVTSYRYEYY
jgi:hypothetical protein